MRCLFEVIREIGFLSTFPLMMPLHDNSHTLSWFIEVTFEERILPAEDEGVRSVQQSEDPSVVKDPPCNN